jgi:hypothetical protein
MSTRNYELKWYVGAGTTHDLAPTEVAEILRDVLAAEFGGGTVVQGIGFWTNPHGETFSEPAVVGETHATAIDTGGMLALRKHGATVAARLAALLGQQAVRYTMRALAYVDDVTPDHAQAADKAA